MRRRTVCLVAALSGWGLLTGPGCAHRREVFYPNEPGVHVRAPFVDVRVKTPPKPAGYADGMARRRDRDEDDD